MTTDDMMAGGTQTAGGAFPAGLRVSLLDAAGRTLPIEKTPATVGRKTADVLVNDPTVSTLHAVVERGPDGFTVTDKGSTNGTFVNGKRAAGPTPIANLDELRFGEARFTFSVVQDQPGEYREPAHADTQQTMIIATAPTVAQLPAGKLFYLGFETAGLGQTARLALRITTVGRSEGDVNIDDAALSRKHFQIEVHPDRIAVKDLGSANGTHVEGKPVSYAVVAPGQTFTAGRTRFRIDVKE